MAQENFKVKPHTKENREENAVVSEGVQPDTEQNDQPQDSQESQSTEGKILPEPRNIDVIKNEINHHWHQVEQSFIMLGKLLIEARAQAPHGTWYKWLQDNTEISPVTARRLIRIVEDFASNQSPGTDLSYSKASILLTLPKDDRKSFVEESHKINGTMKIVSDMSKREFESAVRERKKLKSPNKPEELLNSTGNQESDAVEEGEATNSDPVSFLFSQVVHLEHIIDDVLGILANQVDNTEEQDELISTLRRICDKALRELPPEKSVSEEISE